MQDLPSSLGAGIKDGAWPHEPAVQEQQLGQDHPLSVALRCRERLRHISEPLHNGNGRGGSSPGTA